MWIGGHFNVPKRIHNGPARSKTVHSSAFRCARRKRRIRTTSTSALTCSRVNDRIASTSTVEAFSCTLVFIVHLPLIRKVPLTRYVSCGCGYPLVSFGEALDSFAMYPE